MRKYLKTIKGYVILSILCYCIETAITSVILLLPGYLIDHYQDGLQKIGLISLVYFLLFIAYLFVCYSGNRAADFRRVKFEKAIKKDFFNAVYDKNYQDFNCYDTGEYLSMQSNDITEMIQNYLSPLLAIYRSLIMIAVFGGSLIVFVNPVITIAIIGCSVFAVFVPWLTANELSKRNGNYSNSVGKYTSKLKTYFEAHEIMDKNGVETIKRKNENDLDSLLNDNMYFRKLNSFSMVLNGGSTEFVAVISFIVIAFLLFSNRITVGMATAAFVYSTKFTDPIYELSLNIGRVKSVKKIQEKLIEISTKKSESNLKPLKNIQKITVTGVKKSFGEVNIEIPDMEFIFPKKYLIIGENGIGKSVLFRMLMKFYEPDCGAIQYDGIECVNIDSLNTYSPQSTIVFKASYVDNVTLFGTYSKEKLSEYESYFPSELISQIKQNICSGELSGGEKQVVGLLRALCSQKKIILLDEPFSAMNNAVIEKFLNNFGKINSMIIIVAHNINEHSDKFDRTYTFMKDEDARLRFPIANKASLKSESK